MGKPKRKARKKPPAKRGKPAPRVLSFRAHPTGLPAGPSFIEHTERARERIQKRIRAAEKGVATKRRKREARERAAAKGLATKRRKKIAYHARAATDALADYIQTRDEADYNRYRRNKRVLFQMFEFAGSEPSDELRDIMIEVLENAGWLTSDERALRIIRLS